MIRINVKPQIDGILADFKELSRPQVAVSRAINKTLISVRASAATAIKDAGYQLKASDIKKRLALRRASTGLLVGEVRPNGKPIPLIQYGAREQKRKGGGVSVNVLHGRKLILGAFIATMPSGHRGVFVRVGSAAHAALIRAGKAGGIKHGKTEYKHGLPIIELYGPSIPSTFANQAVTDALTRVANERFPIVLQQELNYLRLRTAA